MKHAILIILIFTIVCIVQAKVLVGPQLQEILNNAKDTTLIEIMIVMEEQSNEEYLTRITTNLPRREKRYPVIAELKKLATKTQAPLLKNLEVSIKEGKVTDIKSFWIVNAIYCRTTPNGIENLCTNNGIRYIESPYIVSKNILLVEGEPVPVNDVRGIEWNILKIAADSCWALGYKGQNIIVGMIDTGINYNHLDLRDHMWTDPNYPHHGWNFEENNDDPIDVRGHGTHCAGTVGSDGSAGDTCGVAPECLLMACRVTSHLNYPLPDTIAEWKVFDAMQFCISPPLSPTHGADIISMSMGWHAGTTPRRSLWRKAVTNVALAGIPYFLAAGNNGPGNMTYIDPPRCLVTPGDVPGPWHHPQEEPGRLGGAISAGATDISDNYCTFSSIGPTSWEDVAGYWDYPYTPGPGLLKPDISAPGDNITSCAYNNDSGYWGGWSGTSMATPHCSGLAALLLSKNPELTVAQIDSIIQMTARDRGPSGKDNQYGAGRIQAKSAIDNTPASGGAIDLRLAEKGTVLLDHLPFGNNNGFFEPSERITLIDTVVNAGTITAPNVTGILRTDNIHITIIDSTSTYGTIIPYSSGDNNTDPFVMKADTLIGLGEMILFQLELTSDSYTRVLDFHVKIGGVCGPDSAGYYILDNSDSLYTEAPEYNWIEINPNRGGSGTPIGTTGGLGITRIPLPFAMRHYGRREADSIYVCKFGWIALGTTTCLTWNNSRLPKLMQQNLQGGAPNMIAGFWDSISVASPGSWWYYHDVDSHRFVIEYDSVYNHGYYQFFEFVIYDSTSAGPGNSNDIIVQYKRVFEPTSITVGQQDSAQWIGWTYLFESVYDEGAAAIEDGRAVKFTTKKPRMKQWIVGREESKNYAHMGTHTVMICPNPAHRRVNISYNIKDRGHASLKVYNVCGQLVKTFFDEHKNPGIYQSTWDGCDNLGRRVPSGVYFYSLEENNTSCSVRGIIFH
jgi:subtilisin family serine protease